MKKKILFLLFGALFFVSASNLSAQDAIPSYYPTVVLKSVNNDSIYSDNESYSGNAPALLIMNTNAENIGDYSCTFEWIITRQEKGSTEIETILDRYLNDDEETEFTFEQSGTFTVVCYATFINGSDTIICDEQYRIDKNLPKWTFTFFESSLIMPNFFSPGNGDDANNTYKPKSFKSIVEFHAKIYNRWGQKLYEWDDINSDGWDGTYKGHQVKDGVYYCLVHAKGADGRNITIRKDVNILRSVDSSYTNNK